MERINRLIFLSVFVLLSASTAWCVCGEDSYNRQNSALSLLTGIDTLKGLYHSYDQIPTAADLYWQTLALETSHPYAREVCASTKLIRKAAQKDDPLAVNGVDQGHEFYFLKGVCVDTKATYPRLILCKGANPAQPSEGVTISVNNMFADANWVAIPNMKLALDGGVKDGDSDPFHHAAQNVKDYYRGIHLNRDGPNRAPAKPAGMSDQEWAALLDEGTGNAIGLGRNIDCERSFTNAETMQTIVNGLNRRNDEAHAHGFHYDGATNNCATLGRDVFEEIGDPSYKKAEAANHAKVSFVAGFVQEHGLKPLIEKIYPIAKSADLDNLMQKDIAAPTNELHRYMYLARSGIESPLIVFGDPQRKDALMKFHELAYHGVSLRTSTVSLGTTVGRQRTGRGSKLPQKVTT